MRVMVLIKATEGTEAGAMPSQEELEQMTAFNEELVNAGVMVAGDGLHPTSRGVRVVFNGGEREVIDGPFPETEKLLAGYWLWQVRSLDEAVEWAQRIPNPTGEHGVVEIRPVYDVEDFGPELTPELREKSQRLARQLRERAEQEG